MLSIVTLLHSVQIGGIMSWRGPAALFLAWAIHDVEEALTFPATCARLAERTGIEALKITPRQSWGAVGLMGGVVSTACLHGAKTDGESKLYRASLPGLKLMWLPILQLRL